MQQIVVGTVKGTGKPINVSLGFIPVYVKLYNDNDADNLAPTIEWFSGMSAGSGRKTLRIIDRGNTGKSSSMKIITKGISIFAGNSNAPCGFTIGADTDINKKGETIYYMVYR